MILDGHGASARAKAGTKEGTAARHKLRNNRNEELSMM